jgi:hypothetical protein
MLTMEVNCKSLRQRTQLAVKLQYTGKRNIKALTSDLPWVDWSMTLVAVEIDHDSTYVAKERNPVHDSVSGEIALKPGLVLSGEIDLRQCFPNINEVLKRRDVLLFWSYQMNVIDGKPLPRVGGWLLIPRW